MTPAADRAEPERTDDGRYIVVGGRRWRATDPSIPEPLRQALVDELMSARRAVRRHRDDATAVRTARDRVHRAKIALGERGTPWWDTPTPDDLAARARATALALTETATGVPTVGADEIAQVIASPAWQAALPTVTVTVDRLVADGVLAVDATAGATAGTPRYRRVG